MVLTGLEIISDNFPGKLKGKRIGVLCHAPSITSDFRHITDILSSNKECRLSAIFGPQHGLFGQTQANMIEWEGEKDTVNNIFKWVSRGQGRGLLLLVKNISQFIGGGQSPSGILFHG